jgi:hypothetical protein
MHKAVYSNKTKLPQNKKERKSESYKQNFASGVNWNEIYTHTYKGALKYKKNGQNI